MIESIPDRLSADEVIHVASTCLCFRTQRAARALARRFDAAFRPFGLTNGQFSLLMALNTPEPRTLGPLAEFLAMDRTSLTAMLKPLRRRGLLTVAPGDLDRRVRHVSITPEGVALLTAALPVWRESHGALDLALGAAASGGLKAGLAKLVGQLPAAADGRQAKA